MPTRKPGTDKEGRAWCFYGRAGSGKTTLAASFPGPVLLLNIRDDGDDSVSDIKGLDVRDIETWDDIEDTYWWLKQNPGKYKTVIWDTVTMAQLMVVEEIGGAKAAKAKKAVGDWGTMTKKDWGEVASRLKTWITNYRDLDMEVIFLAQDRLFNVSDDDEVVEEDLEPEMGPALSPAVMKHLCAAVSVVANTTVRTTTKKRGLGKKAKEVEVTEYCLRLGPNASYITKFRKPKKVSLPDFLIDPTYENILETIKGAT